MSGPSINPIPTTKFIESATGSDHAPNEATAALRAELDKEELLEAEYQEMGLPMPAPTATSRPRLWTRLKGLLSDR